MSSRKKTEQTEASASKKNEEKQITIPGVTVRTATITIVGTSPLLVNKFSNKAKTEIEDKQTGKAKAKKAFRDPEKEYRDSLYVMPGAKNRYGIPATGLKNCGVSACKYVDGINQTFARGAFHIIPGPGGLVEIKGKPTMDESIVRIGPFGKKSAMPRYRGRFDEWEISFSVRYNSNVISPEQICNLFETGGFSIGLCEWRPEKSGPYGMFQVSRQ